MESAFLINSMQMPLLLVPILPLSPGPGPAWKEVSAVGSGRSHGMFLSSRWTESEKVPRRRGGLDP